MYIIQVKYREQKELDSALNGIEKTGRIIRLHKPSKGDTWYKIRVDVEPNEK